jgi:hypothetical protein
MRLKYTYLLYLLLFPLISFSQQPKKTAGATPKKPTTSGSQKKTTIASKGGTTDLANRNSLNGNDLASSSAISGVWRGFFTSGSGFFQEKYKYEVQIGQLNSNGIKGVTYSYRTTVFYGKANLVGMYTPSTKNLVLKENKLLEVKMSNGDACLMTCYLDYSRVGGTEVLEGTFTSINTERGTDCGSGRVYLEKVPESDFYKEDFVKEFEAKKKATPPKSTTGTTKTSTPKKDIVAKPKPVEKPPVKKITRKDDLAKIDPPVIPPSPNAPEKKLEKVKVQPVEDPKKTPPARELKERENTITKVIQAEGDEIQIELYDNGQIDDDTITVYHNKQVVAWKKRLCHQPITIKIQVDRNHPRNEFVMVADNLGSIPPNTALMVIRVGRQRFDVFLTSSFQKNATVIIDCKPPSNDTK